MIQPNSEGKGGDFWVLPEKFTALGLEATALSRKPGFYNMFVIHLDKSMSSTLKSKVLYWRKTRPNIKAVILHSEMVR